MRYSHTNLIRTSFISVHATCPLHLILIVLIILVIFGEVHNLLGCSDFLLTLIASPNVSSNTPSSLYLSPTTSIYAIFSVQETKVHVFTQQIFNNYWQ